MRIKYNVYVCNEQKVVVVEVSPYILISKIKHGKACNMSES